MTASQTRVSRRHFYTGSVYLYVLASSLLVTVLGLGALATVRVQMRAMRLAREGAEARAAALAAIELGRLQIKQNPNWRTMYPNGTWLDSQTLGAAQFTLQGIDPVDGVLSDSAYEPVLLTGIGTRGLARHKVQVTLTAVVKPLTALSTCLAASDQIVLNASRQITVFGASLTTNTVLRNSGMIDGNVEAQSANPLGVTGTPTIPGTVRPMPDPGVFADYLRRATAVPYASTLQDFVLTPGGNSLGPTDPNGLYVIDTSGGNITIKNCRIYGTLIIRAANHTVTIGDAAFLQNYRSDFPVLLVEGNLVLASKSAAGPLSEAVCNTNFNPTGAPYNGVTDTDILDLYPNEIRGLVHVKGSLTLQETARLVGVVICEGTIYGQGADTIVYDPSLSVNPPMGYTYVEGMQVSSGTWEQVVD
jgi:hypothetical protein